MMRAAYLLLLALVLVVGSAPEGYAAKRVPPVIGNDAYEQVDRLRKTVNDARAMGEVLKAMRERLAALKARLNKKGHRTPGNSAPFVANAVRPPPSSSPQTAAVKRPGQTFRDCPTCPEMVVVPEGRFMMGSNGGRYDEKPVHRVTIAKPFAVGKYEVMWDEWEACVAEAACDNGPVAKAGGDNGWGKGRRPVIEVSWHDTKKYVAWLNSKVTGKPYRILSEAEWEYAARAGTTTQYHWGDAFDLSKANNSNKAVPVGQYAPNRFGLYDMHGNVLEWVQDCYKESYNGAPADGRSVSETSGCLRVLRSGAWSYGSRVLRAGNRYGTAPVDRMNIVGFRVARTLSP